MGGGVSWNHKDQFQPQQYHRTDDLIQPRTQGVVSAARIAKYGYDGEIDIEFEDAEGHITYRSLHFHSANWLNTTCLASEDAFKKNQLVGTRVSFFIDSYFTNKKGTRGTALGMTFAPEGEVQAPAEEPAAAKAETGNADTGAP